MSLTWDDLAAAALARQLPDDADGTGPPNTPGALADAVRRTGAIQSQTARSTFLGLAARFPGVAHETVTAAFEVGAILRGSTLRGTVHTVTADHHPLHEAATRLARRRDLTRVLAPRTFTVDELWDALEAYAATEPRTATDLHEHLAAWVGARDDRDPAEVLVEVGRSLSYTHGGLVRRPLRGGWDGQGPAGYTTSRVPGRRDVVDYPASVTALVRAHLAAHGPASRQDLAWWAGIGLRVVDAALDDLAGEGLTGETGPDGRTYVDLPGAPPPRGASGVRLLPEFDALMCAYEPTARERFVTAAHHAVLWNQKNATVLPPVLVDGRITGYWRAMGSARRRPLEVTWWAGTRRPRTSELAGPVAAVETALGITVTEVTVAREAV